MANDKNFKVKHGLSLAENLIFEGSTEDNFETTVGVTDPTADQTITFPDNSGEVVLVDSVDGGIGDIVWVIGQPQYNGTNLGKLKIWSIGDTGTFSASILQYSDVSQIYAAYDTVNYFGQNDLHLLAGGNGKIWLDTAVNSNSITLRTNQTLSFEGSTNDDYETELTVVDPTADRTITFPDESGDVVLKDSTTKDIHLENDEKVVLGDSDHFEIYYDSTDVTSTIASSSSDMRFLRTNDSTPTFQFVGENDSFVGPVIAVKHESTTPAALDWLHTYQVSGNNDAAQDVAYVSMIAFARDITDGSEDGYYKIRAAKAGNINLDYLIINDTNADVTVGRTGAVLISNGTTAERPSTGENGMIRYNTDNERLEGYVDSGWKEVATEVSTGKAIAMAIVFG